MGNGKWFPSNVNLYLSSFFQTLIKKCFSIIYFSGHSISCSRFSWCNSRCGYDTKTISFIRLIRQIGKCWIQDLNLYYLRCKIYIYLEAKTGIFKAAKPFTSISSIGHNAAMFGSIMGVQRFSCKSLEIIRQKQDFLNEIFGFGITYKYYTYFLGSSEERLIRHNRIFGGIFLGAILYGHLAVF